MNHDTDIPTQAAKLLFRLWQSAPETDEDGERIRPKDYVELAIHAALRGEGQYSTSTIKRRLSAENEITAPTKLPVGPLIVRWEPNNYQDGYHAPKWEVNGWLQDAGQLLHRLEIGPAEAAKLTAQGMDERELVESLRRNVPSALVEKLSSRARSRAPDDNRSQDWYIDLALKEDQEGRGPWVKEDARLRPTPHMDMWTVDFGALKEEVQQASFVGSAPKDADSNRSKPASEPSDGGASSENISQLSGENEEDANLSNEIGKESTENNSQKFEDEWSWDPDDLRRRTCDHSTRQAIFEYVPEARDDEWVFRYCVYVLWSDFTDNQCGLQVLPASACDWIAGYENDTAKDVIEYIQSYLPLEYTDHIPNRRCRLIEEDGLPADLKRIVRKDLSTPPSNYDDRVYVLSGAPYTRKKVTQRREEIFEGLQDERSKAPSIGAQKTYEMLNFGCETDLRSGQLLSKMKHHLGEAFEYVRRMEIDPDLSKEENESHEDWRRRKWKAKRDQRNRYFDTLSAISDQHQQFYAFSSTGRTDRLFGYNRSVLELPKEVRAILCQDFIEVDLKSAHLLIAAWLWDADKALEKLTSEDYSIWDDLMQHFEKLFRANGHDVPQEGEDLYKTVKSALKRAVYSTVYGMHAPSIQAQVTKNLKNILGPEAGAHLRGHPVIAELLEKRDEKLAEMEVGDVFVGPTGIRIEIEQGLSEDGDDVDPRSAMATLAQSYEQAAMQVILEMERDRQQADSYNHFNVVLWLHDGAYVKMRSEQARSKDLNRRLEERCRELAEHAGKEDPMPAFFEIEQIEPPTPKQQRTEDTARCPKTNQASSTITNATPPTATDGSGKKANSSENVAGADNSSMERPASADSDTSTADVKGSSDPRGRRSRGPSREAIRQESRRLGRLQDQRDVPQFDEDPRPSKRPSGKPSWEMIRQESRRISEWRAEQDIPEFDEDPRPARRAFRGANAPSRKTLRANGRESEEEA